MGFCGSTILPRGMGAMSMSERRCGGCAAKGISDQSDAARRLRAAFAMVVVLKAIGCRPAAPPIPPLAAPPVAPTAAPRSAPSVATPAVPVGASGDAVVAAPLDEPFLPALRRVQDAGVLLGMGVACGDAEAVAATKGMRDM